MPDIQQFTKALQDYWNTANAMLIAKRRSAELAGELHEAKKLLRCSVPLAAVDAEAREAINAAHQEDAQHVAMLTTAATDAHQAIESTWRELHQRQDQARKAAAGTCGPAASILSSISQTTKALGGNHMDVVDVALTPDQDRRCTELLRLLEKAIDDVAGIADAQTQDDGREAQEGTKARGQGSRRPATAPAESARHRT